MSQKENIFTYATKELTQDAFLIWLLNNHNSEFDDVKEASQILLKEFLNIPLSNKLEIENLKTTAQEKSIDILVECKVNGEDYIIAIEDKTNSTVHGDQLNRYRSHVNKKPVDIKNKVFIYYKTNLMTKEEKKEVGEWLIFDIESIKEVFSKITVKLDHYLLKSYVEHINHLYKDLKGDLPKNVKDWNLRNWHNFAIKEKWLLPENIVVKYGNYEGRYYIFNFCLKDKSFDFPYLHLLSRDIQGSRDIQDCTFIIKFKIDENKKDIIDQNLERWKTNISKNKLFKNQNYKQQKGISIAQENFSTVEELVSLVEKYLKEFISIIKE